MLAHSRGIIAYGDERPKSKVCGWGGGGVGGWCMRVRVRVRVRACVCVCASWSSCLGRLLDELQAANQLD